MYNGNTKCLYYFEQIMLMPIFLQGRFLSRNQINRIHIQKFACMIRKKYVTTAGLFFPSIDINLCSLWLHQHLFDWKIIIFLHR